MITQNLQPTCPANPDPSICAACAAKSHTCCYVSPGNEDQCFPLSQPEQARILPYCSSSLGGKKAFTKSPNSQEFLIAMRSLFPGEQALLDQLFPSGQYHLRMATLKTGYCAFLGEQGCILPRNARPWFCKLFPFWFQHGELTAFAANYCLVAKGAISPAGMLNIMGQEQAVVLEIFNQLRLDWGLVPTVPGIKPGK